MMKKKIALFAVLIVMCSVFASAFDALVYSEFLEGSKSTVRIFMEPGDLAKFDHNGKTYNIVNWLTTQEQVGLQITPSNLRFSLVNGGSKKIDVENDGIEDFEIKINSIDESKAEIYLTDLDLVSLDVPAVNETATALNESLINITTNISDSDIISNNSGESQDDNGSTFSWTTILIIAGVIVILAVIAYLLLRGKKKSSGINVKD